MAALSSFFLLPVSAGSHSLTFSVRNSSSLVLTLSVVYNMSSVGDMSGTGVRKSLSGGSFAVDGGINYTSSETGVTIAWGDSMSKTLVPYFQIHCPDGYTLSDFLVDGVSVDFSMLSKFNVFDGRVVSSASSAMEITPIDLSDLRGTFCKFVAGDLVFYGDYGIWEVIKSTLMVASEDTLVPIYQLRQNVADDNQPQQWRYNVVPQSALTLYVAPTPTTGV